MKYLIIVIGPTAIGKTSLSIALAQFFCCEILSCDSRQFYKEMKIGTAVPYVKDLTKIKHHFIHNKSILDNYTVGDYEKEALSTLENLYKNNDYAILVGGSGLYINAILNGLDYFPEIDKSVKTSIKSNFEKFGLDYLKHQFHDLDYEFYKKIEKDNPQTLQNPQRLMRFVEVCLSTGKPYSSFLNITNNHRNFSPIIIGLEAQRKTIYERINSRVDIMMKEGLLTEAEKLYPHKNLNTLQTVGYKEIFEFLDQKISLDFAVQEIKKNSRRYAKRQLTWFKKTENVKWFDYQYDINEIIEYIRFCL